MKIKIAIGADHRGFKLKETLKKDLLRQNFTVIDCGCNSPASTDYPKIALKVALAVKKDRSLKGILICGSGIGMSIAANKIRGIRAALSHNLKDARLSRQHNDANILVIDEALPRKTAKAMIRAWLKTKFEGGRHRRRINLIEQMEKRCLK